MWFLLKLIELDESEFSRKDLAIKYQLFARFLVPNKSGNQILGVLELFWNEEISLNDKVCNEIQVVCNWDWYLKLL